MPATRPPLCQIRATRTAPSGTRFANAEVSKAGRALTARLEDRVDKGLDEARTLILGAQVLLGFNFHAVFAPSFDRLPEISRYFPLGRSPG